MGFLREKKKKNGGTSREIWLIDIFPCQLFTYTSSPGYIISVFFRRVEFFRSPPNWAIKIKSLPATQLIIKSPVLNPVLTWIGNAKFRFRLDRSNHAYYFCGYRVIAVDRALFKNRLKLSVSDHSGYNIPVCCVLCVV